MSDPVRLRVLVEVDDKTVIDIDEKATGWSISVDTPVMDVSPEGPFKKYEHSGWWYLNVRALREAKR